MRQLLATLLILLLASDWAFSAARPVEPPTAIAPRAEPGVPASGAEAVHAALCLQPVRELDPARLAELTRAGLAPRLLRQPRPRGPRFDSEAAQIGVVILGAAMVLIGASMAAVAGTRLRINDPITGMPVIETSTNQGMLVGGLALAGGGGMLVWYGVARMD